MCIQNSTEEKKQFFLFIYVKFFLNNKHLSNSANFSEFSDVCTSMNLFINMPLIIISFKPKEEAKTLKVTIYLIKK